MAGYYSGGNHDKAKAWQEEQHKDGFDIGISFGNVRELTSTKNCVADVQRQLGHLDILVNNAGVTRDAMFHKMRHEDWHDVITANLNSLFHVTSLAINHMIERKYGRIINISSVNAQKGQLGQTNYSAAKAGMHGFTKALAQEVARKGITVNTVSPGYVATEMVMAVPEEIRDKIIAQIPVGRLGRPEEIAGAVAYLVSDEAGFITGSNLAINGGQHMY